MKKGKVLIITCLFAIFVANGVAQNSLLWKISGNGLQQPSYLFGTIHIICEDDFFLDSTVSSAIDQCSKMVFEVDMSNPSVMQKAQAGSMNPNGKNFKNDLSLNDQHYLDSCLKADLKAGLNQLGVLKPWALMVTYSILDIIHCENTKQYESELLQLALQKKMTIGELETVEYQLGLFDSIPYQRQLKMLMETVREKDLNNDEFDKLLEAYIGEDINKIYELMMQEDEMVEYSQLFFYNRNRNWIPKIKVYAAKESVFVAVGAGHLGGEGGLIDLLTKEGYTVSPVIPQK